MNTLNGNVPHVSKGDNVILLSDLEFAMPKEQLQLITKLHNEGMRLEDIVNEVKRNPYEVLIALIHQVKQGKKLRPLAYRRVLNEIRKHR
jgi:hypothetical protein